MAYAAVTCLRTTILRILNSCRISVVWPTRRMMKSLYKELGSLREVLEISACTGFNALDGKIIQVVHEIEDSLELHELNQFLSQSQVYGDVELMREISSFAITVKKIKREYKKEVHKSLPDVEAGDYDKDYDNIPLDEEEDQDQEEEEEEEEEEEYDAVEEGADGDDFCWNTVKLRSNEFKKIKQFLVQKCNNYVFSIVGMAGIGKTTLAQRILKDPFIIQKFECRAFFRIGQNYELDKLKQGILAQINPKWDKFLVEKNEGIIDECLKEYLCNKRYLIVLDDVWNVDFWDYYFKDRRRRDKAKGSRILLTTRLEDLAISLGDYFYMPFFETEESWNLLRMKVFADKVCPPELEKEGMKIAEKCDGLPLTIVTVASILSKAEKTQEYWKEVTLKKSWVFESAYDQILHVLYPSFYNLPPQAKACFLYMAAFPPSHEVRLSKLVNLWCTEGFLEPKDSTPMKAFASKCFDKIVLSQTVVPGTKLSSDRQNYQSCTLHSVFRHLCNKELDKIEFLHIIQSKEDGATRGRQGSKLRRVAIYYNVLWSIKDVYTSLDSSPTARSLLCTGAHHKYEVPVNFSLRLLRVCDVSTIRFYEFPVKVLELVQLRYFAITCNANLPPSISKLWKLQHLIVHRHLCITSAVAESYLPVEVWYLQELIHLEIMGRNLPNPPCTGVKLEHLVKILDVGIHTCSEGVLTSIPKLQKLRVKIELTPESAEPLSNLDHISHLTGLLSFQCVIVNPVLMPAAPSFSISSPSIIKLTLSGLGYPWKYLNKFVKLPHLKVLKLLCYAFGGEKWEVEENAFLKLECLTIEDTNLVHWEVGEGSFPCLAYLSLKHCYKLQTFSEISSFHHIEMVDCNSVAVTCAKQMDCSLTYSWDTATDSRNEISKIYTVDLRVEWMDYGSR